MVAVIAAVLVLAIPVAAMGVIGTAVVLFASGEGSEQSGVCAPIESTAMTAIPGPGSTEISLQEEQVANAAVIVHVGSEAKISQAGVLIALMVALRESTLRNLANPTVPESLEYPHEGEGSDLDSVNVFQQRPSAGWGSVEELMTPRYAAEAFFGGDDGPNQGSPPGLLDTAGWEQMELGEAGQAVQDSAHPEAYDQWRPTAQHLLQELGGSCSTGVSADGWTNPAPGQITGTFGPRGIICTGGICTPAFHDAVDIANAAGTPVAAAAAGTVSAVYTESMGGNIVEIDHGGGVTTLYAHLLEGSFAVAQGEEVAAGQTIALMGSTGSASTGPHLHFGLRIDGTAVDPMTFMEEQGVTLGTN
ncbi:M23 family metallopeptidase [Agrococcus casei]|uniref:Membrane proteins related to metalloendopeptidases n=1 Tax=Agrococcus casei LMG 22410 TaxID=1255656 RepID=A0A1R4FIQ4_9MICO|nr:M23 family metallopeptidase [Agrococcus casei]SJM55759.1 Membrane proteins related to metalloendopeptidases [Agrococcus casei LMG 22410]